MNWHEKAIISRDLLQTKVFNHPSKILKVFLVRQTPLNAFTQTIYFQPNLFELSDSKQIVYYRMQNCKMIKMKEAEGKFGLSLFSFNENLLFENMLDANAYQKYLQEVIETPVTHL